MDVVTLSPLQVSGLAWQPRQGAHALTVICKATYLLQPGESPLAPEQDAVNDQESHWNDDPTRSVYAPSDRVPFKARADVLLVGHAFAPGQQPVRSLMVRIVVGDVDKAIEVFCDRRIRIQDHQLLEGQRFAKMPLRWERAAGGPETSNPAGARFDAPPDVYGMIAIPNLQPVGVYVGHPSDAFAPIGFGPVGARWPGRMEKLGHRAASFHEQGWEAGPLPEGFDYGYFNAAPPDQQTGALRANERIVLENLHQEHARLVTSLPGVHPRATVERSSGAREEIALRADTLWIDTDRGRCTLTWRGQVALGHPREAGRVSVSMAPSPVAAAVREPTDDAVMTIAGGGAARLAQAIPFLAPAVTGTSERSAPEPRSADAALPFGRTEGVAPLPAHLSKASSATETIFVPSVPTESQAPAPAPPPLPIPPPALPPLAPPAMVSIPPLATPEPEAQAPWSLASQEAGAGPSVGQRMLQSPVEAARPTDAPPPLPHTHEEPHARDEFEAEPSPMDETAAKRGWKPSAGRTRGGAKGAPLSPNPVLGGAASASDAAAARARKEGADRPAGRRVVSSPLPPPKAVIELLWHDPSAMPRIRRQPGWKEILGHIKGKAFEDELSGDSPPEKKQEIKDRRDVAGLLARGDALDMRGLEAALGNAVTEDGTFVPPLALVAGELELPFDELETLKATMAALAPLASGDKRLQETLATTEELLKTSWLKGASGIAEGLTAKLKEAYAQGNRALPPRYLEGHTERMLLEQRAYQKRTVMGKACIRSLLAAPGGQVPVYLPEALAQELPSFQRFEVRLVGELRGRVDQYEVQEVALRGVAVGRVASAGASRALR